MGTPSGGFSPTGSSGGSGVSGLVFQRTRSARCGRKRWASSPKHAVVDLAKRCEVVEDEEAPPMSGEREVVVLDDQVPHRGRRQIEPQQVPVLAVVERDM